MSGNDCTPDSRAGFVLAGGRSSRMGRDKALLPFRGATLVEYVARAVAEAAGSVTLIGPPERYSALGFRVIPDEFPGSGPLAGIHAALRSSAASWNLIVACDMPAVPVPLLRALLDAARASDADCLIPSGPSGRPEPLCAVYHVRCLPAASEALRRHTRKVTDALAGLNLVPWPVAEASWFDNVNTPAEWAGHAND